MDPTLRNKAISILVADLEMQELQVRTTLGLLEKQLARAERALAQAKAHGVEQGFVRRLAQSVREQRMNQILIEQNADRLRGMIDEYRKLSLTPMEVSA